jgi:hypothetical protein
MLPDIQHYRFYEKVVKVKADVAAILSFLSVAVLIQRGQHISDATLGGCARGVSAERFETPLAGGAAALAAAWGEPSPPRLSPRGNGKGESNSLLPQAILSITDLHVAVP